MASRISPTMRAAAWTTGTRVARCCAAAEDWSAAAVLPPRGAGLQCPVIAALARPHTTHCQPAHCLALPCLLRPRTTCRGSSNLRELQRKLEARVMIRRLKRDVLQVGRWVGGRHRQCSAVRHHRTASGGDSAVWGGANAARVFLLLPLLQDLPDKIRKRVPLEVTVSFHN